MSIEQPVQHRVLIVGLGKTGLSCARYLSAQGVQVAITDTREQPPGLAVLQQELPDVATFMGGFDDNVFASADELIVSPGVSLQHPLIEQARRQGKQITGDIELFAQRAKAPVIAVTGSNGKSTVTSLVGVMARESGRDARVGGNIGQPVLELLQGSEPDCYVLELSSFQLEYTASLNARVAAVLNISADHMDRYENLDSYTHTKQRVYRGDGVMVLNRDDPQVMAMAEDGRQVVSFGLDVPDTGQYGVVETGSGERYLYCGDTPLVDCNTLLIPGEHNIANALAAIAIAEAAGFERNAIIRALQGFRGLPHRTEFIAEVDGVRWYNDSKGTNTGAALAAIRGLPGPLVWIAGGQGKGADFSVLRDAVQQNVELAILIGEDADRIRAAIEGACRVEMADSLELAVTLAAHNAQPGQSVLLSPACASFDMFENFEQRGQVFAGLVRGLQ